MCTSALDAIYTSSSRGDAYQNYVAVGSESGVVSLYDYTSPVGSRASKPQPTLLKSVMNLTTKATTVKFHPSGQIMAIASNEVIIFESYIIYSCILS